VELVNARRTLCTVPSPNPSREVIRRGLRPWLRSSIVFRRSNTFRGRPTGRFNPERLLIPLPTFPLSLSVRYLIAARSRISSHSNSAAEAGICRSRRLVGFTWSVSSDRLVAYAVAREGGQLLVEVQYRTAEAVDLPDDDDIEAAPGAIRHQGIERRAAGFPAATAAALWRTRGSPASPPHPESPFDDRAIADSG
jgi:hypothetical protein